MSEIKKIKVGIIAAPERTDDISKKIIGQLGDLFSKHVDEKVDWEVDRVVDRLTGTAEASQDILYNAQHIKTNKKWDYAICLTDLPIFYHKDIVVADISFKYKVAQISMPAFGWAPINNRIMKTIIQLLSELHRNYTTDQPKQYHSIASEKQHEKSKFYIFKQLFSKMPIRRQENPNILFKSNLDYVNNELRYIKHSNTSNTKIEHSHEHKKSSEQADSHHKKNDNNIDVRFLMFPKLIGQLRLILGMTFANNPMKIMSSFKHVIAIAFTTGVFALIFPTIWNLAQILSIYRLSGMMITAIFGLVIWIIVAHNLWEYASKRNKPIIRRFYNLATLFTLLIDVITYYICMFILFFIACLVIIPVEYFQSMINDYNDMGSTLVNYVRVAWATTSISTIVSAIGAGLENEELVRNITYGYRQTRRYKEMDNKNS